MAILKKSNFSIERARAAFGKQSNPNSEYTPYYAFYKLPEGKSSTLRFIPDANQDNELGFLLERRMHELVINGEKQRVACLEMYGEKCPLCETSRQYYKAKDNTNGKKFWPKKDHMARALIVKDGLPADASPGGSSVGKVMSLSIGKTLYDKIAHSISSGELGDDLPCEFVGGTDFVITRTTKPGPTGEKWSDYSLSNFARSSRSLEEEEIALLEQTDDNGGTPNYVELKTLLPKKPSIEFVENLLNQALNDGSAPIPQRSVRSASASNQIDDAPTTTRPGAKPVTAVAVDEDEDAEAFLAQIKARRAAAANQRGE